MAMERTTWGRFVRPTPLIGRPSVSVVIPCYNYGHYLPEAVGSALAQERVDVEVIVVDDHSTDNSRDVARRLADGDPRIQLIEHPVNLGHIRTYNDGLARATGDYVVLLSADDLLAPGALARAAAVFEAFPDVGLVYGFAVDFDGQPPVASTRPTGWTVWHGNAWLWRICQRGTNIIVNPEAIIRRSLMMELVGYDPDLPQAADMDVWMRAAARANVARVNGVDQAFYRVHGANMHTTDFAGVLTDAQERLKVFERFFAAHRLEKGDRMLSCARRIMAIEALRHACLGLDADGRHGGAEPSAYAEFAVLCDPSIRRTWRWEAYAHRLRRPAGSFRRLVTAQAESLRWKVRWRRWRRFGT